jgi:DNA-directed RNA polymerase subunit H
MIAHTKNMHANNIIQFKIMKANIMSVELADKKEMLNKKIDLLLRFRGYSIEKETEGENFKDLYIIKEDESTKLLLRVIYKTTLVSGKVGVQYVRKMKEKIDKEEYVGGILIGDGFSYSAKKESKANAIETIAKSKIPSFNLFKHNLVPLHEILEKKDAKSLLEKYHIEPYQLPRIRLSDPAVFLIGAKYGDIIKITRRSPTAGIHITFRHVR